MLLIILLLIVKCDFFFCLFTTESQTIQILVGFVSIGLGTGDGDLTSLKATYWLGAVVNMEKKNNIITYQ